MIQYFFTQRVLEEEDTGEPSDGPTGAGEEKQQHRRIGRDLRPDNEQSRGYQVCDGDARAAQTDANHVRDADPLRLRIFRRHSRVSYRTATYGQSWVGVAADMLRAIMTHASLRVSYSRFIKNLWGENPKSCCSV